MIFIRYLIFFIHLINIFNFKLFNNRIKYNFLDNLILESQYYKDDTQQLKLKENNTVFHGLCWNIYNSFATQHMKLLCNTTFATFTQKRFL